MKRLSRRPPGIARSVPCAGTSVAAIRSRASPAGWWVSEPGCGESVTHSLRSQRALSDPRPVRTSPWGRPGREPESDYSPAGRPGFSHHATESGTAAPRIFPAGDSLRLPFAPEYRILALDRLNRLNNSKLNFGAPLQHWGGPRPFYNPTLLVDQR